VLDKNLPLRAKRAGERRVPRVAPDVGQQGWITLHAARNTRLKDVFHVDLESNAPQAWNSTL
jgi:hypothetical protein